MALDVTIGGASSDSYQSLAELLAYFTAYKTAAELAAWVALDDTEEKELHARLGTQWLDAYAHERWKGYRASETQARDWPRSSVEDSDGYAVSSTTLPTALLHANAEAVFRSSVGTSLIPDGAAGSNITSESKSLGPMSKSVTYAGSKDAAPSFPLIDRLLAGLVDGSPSGFGARQLERA